MKKSSTSKRALVALKDALDWINKTARQARAEGTASDTLAKGRTNVTKRMRAVIRELKAKTQGDRNG